MIGLQKSTGLEESLVYDTAQGVACQVIGLLQLQGSCRVIACNNAQCNLVLSDLYITKFT